MNYYTEKKKEKDRKCQKNESMGLKEKQRSTV